MRIILFDLDCLRPDHMGCYGYDRPTCPTIDAVARQGLRFTNFYCADSPCLPSRIGFVSGRFGFNNGVVSNMGAGANFNIRLKPYGGPFPENEMLMRRLRSVGYDTISFSNFADRHSFMWFTLGWTEYHTPNLKGGGETAEEVAGPVMRWLKHNARRENYLLHINYWDIHRCYKVDASWASRFKDYPVAQKWPDEEAIAKQQMMTGPFTATGQFKNVKNGKSPFPLMPDGIQSRKDFERMVTGYDATIAYVDHYVKIVLDELDRQGVLDDAAILFTADHGDAFGEHGIYTDHVCADECIHRVPLIVRWPGVAKESGVCSSLLYNVDLSATLCELLGAPIPREWDGKSFAANLKGEPGLERDYLVWGHALYTVQRAVRTRTHLMVRTYDNWGYNWFQPVELYDMANDPFQTANIRDSEPRIIEKCDHHLNDWIHEQRSKKRVIADPFDYVLNERSRR